MRMRTVMRKTVMKILGTVMVLNLMSVWSSASAEELWCTTAFTMEKDNAKAGQELAKKAKEGCKDRVPKLILVFGAAGSNQPLAEDRIKFMAPLGEQFDKKIIYGCGYRGGAITQETNAATASIMVLGGDIKVTAQTVVPVKEKADGAKVFSEALKPAYDEGKDKGRFVILLGNNGALHDVLKSVQTALGNDVLVFGGATTGREFQYFQGEAIQRNIIGLVVTGDFTCGFGLTECEEAKEKKNPLPESVEATARQAATQAIGDKKDDLLCLLVCSCCSRQMFLASKAVQKLPLELKGLTDATSAPIVGFYGEGEIGHEAVDKPAMVAHCRISVCAIRKAPETGKKE